jgi:hypothetical protein
LTVSVYGVRGSRNDLGTVSGKTPLIVEVPTRVLEGRSMRVGQPARIAWMLAGACMGLVLGSLVLLLAVSHTGDVSQYYYEDAAVAITFALLGAVVAAHRPENPIGWLFLAIGLSGTLGVVSNEYAHYTLTVDPGALPGGAVVAWLTAPRAMPGGGCATRRRGRAPTCRSASWASCRRCS